MNQLVQTGFSLVELMLAVTVVGLLAAIALPTYQDYTVRAKVSEVLMALDGGKVVVAEYFQTYHVMPQTASLGLGGSASNYVAEVSYDRGDDALTGVMSVLARGDSAINGKTFTLTASGDQATGVVLWRCGAQEAFLLKYLPSSCR